MKLKFLSHVDDGLPVVDSQGYQRIIGILHNDGDIIVMYVDAIQNSCYIERVVNKFAIDMFASSNFEVISDEEHEAYEKFFKEQGVMNFANKKT